MFLLRSEAEVVSEIQPRNIRLGRSGGHPRQLAVGRVRQSIDAAESLAAGDLRIEDELQILGQPRIEEQRGGQGGVVLAIILQTKWPCIRGIEGAVSLADGRSLVIQVPILGSRDIRQLSH